MTRQRPAKKRWYRTPWLFAVCGVRLLLLWLVLRWLVNSQSGDAGSHTADLPQRSDVWWAGPEDIIFWVAMVLIAIAVIVRVWRLVRRIRR